MYTYMPFGQYKGRSLATIPTSYLEWLDSLPDLSAPLQAAVRRELQARNGSRPSPQLDLQAVLKRWRGEMALKWHPDRGGDVRAMQAINDGYDRLLQMLGV
jgi:hypothetical protein